MPYCRIVVWIKQRTKPLTSIRFVESGTIDWVQGYYMKKASDRYGSNLIDCEAQQLSKTTTVIQKWLEKNGGKVININR
jgi:hypothetical protein